MRIDDDYIDIELISSPNNNFFCYSITSPPPQTRDFEFQMCSVSSDKHTTFSYSPADELFYKGNLLPLHLPPRMQMVQKLLQNPTFITPSSCNISPSVSRRLSNDELLNPDDDYFFELIGFNHPITAKSWTKRLKRSLLGQKWSLYFKSLFSYKSGSCSNVEPAKSELAVSKEKDCAASKCKLSDYMVDSASLNPARRRSSFSGVIQKGRRERRDETRTSDFSDYDIVVNQNLRLCADKNSSNYNKSFSSSTSSSNSGRSSSSSSFSFSSSSPNGGACYDLQVLKRSASTNSELENSIEGAIAYCKKSQADSGVFVAGGNQEIKA
ncbi:probable membrane-associated kinase regulator 3 [Mercurialis annua]|uniref:probable membrane-associated kinase regulator 3 n=1 Tax=Mercurialis annua TaxID=3986 RepID=UPI00215E00EC|nr:probable membrane-associated kinase regulator 3 [Mercurialis annua]